VEKTVAVRVVEAHIYYTTNQYQLFLFDSDSYLREERVILTHRTDDSVETAVAGTSINDDTVCVTDARLKNR